MSSWLLAIDIASTMYVAEMYAKTQVAAIIRAERIGPSLTNEYGYLKKYEMFKHEYKRDGSLRERTSCK